MEKPLEHFMSEIAGNMAVQIATLKKAVNDLMIQNAVLVAEIKVRDSTIEVLSASTKDLAAQVESLKGNDGLPAN